MSLTQELPVYFRYISGIFPVGVVLHNRAVEYNVAAFSELSLEGKAKQRLVL